MPDPRGGLLRTKTGCLTCRIRRVKCDESKPICVRCTKTGRHCDGYSSVPISRRELIARQFPDPNLTAFERKCFELFRLRTAKADWDIILQLSHMEPSIRHGVLALGSLHHEFEYDAANSLHAYDKAIQHTRSLQDTNKILAACVVFTCYENIMGNYHMANMHLRNGLNIAKQSLAEDEIVQILGRLDFQSMTFPAHDHPYPYEKPKPLDTKIPYSFTTAKDARATMVDIQRWALSISEAYKSGDRSDEFFAVRDSCRDRLRDWKAAFDRSKTENWIPMPKLYWALATLTVGAGCEDSEMAWDGYYGLFEGITNGATFLAKIKSFSLELGTTVPLFTVGTKCRDPRLRRRAVELMKTPRREGIWYSPAAAKVIERIIQIEEGGRKIVEAKDIPEAARVGSIHLDFMTGQNQVCVYFRTRDGNDWHLREEIISY